MNKKAVFEDENGFLVFPAGVEPTAFRLGGERSILLSYGNVLRCYNNTMIAKNQFLNAIWLVLQE